MHSDKPAGNTISGRFVVSTHWAGIREEMGIISKFENWLTGHFKNESYVLNGNEVICGKTRRPDRHFHADDVVEWQLQTHKDRRNVLIKLSGGRIFNWFDGTGALACLLREIAASRELPPVTIDQGPSGQETARWD